MVFFTAVANSASLKGFVKVVIPTTYSFSSMHPLSDVSSAMNHALACASLIEAHTPHAAATASVKSTRPSPFVSTAWNIAPSASRRSSFPAVSARGVLIARGVRGASYDVDVVMRKPENTPHARQRLVFLCERNFDFSEFGKFFLFGAHFHLKPQPLKVTPWCTTARVVRRDARQPSQARGS